jgi:CubicO group peptidase (beta-lactamase class C family)
VEASAARALLADAVERGVTPAAAVEAGTHSASLWTEAFGRHTYDPASRLTATDTIFDLASLTKVIATTSLVMRAVADGRLEVNRRIGHWMPAWNQGARAEIEVRHLLDHSSGLPAHLDLWQIAAGREAYEAVLRELPLAARPGVHAVYSDLGFILLGFLIEHVGGRPLDEQFGELRSLWSGSTQFRPPAADRARIAPTEVDAGGSALCGEVHDENARALGGVAGHAGLFGTVTDVGAFARLVLRCFREDTALASPSLMRTFAAPSSVPGSSRALGWDTMRPTSSCGTLMSANAIGHTGFTGTSLWIDHARDLYVVLLTNRVHPARSNDQHLGLRPRVHDAIVSAFDAVR